MKSTMKQLSIYALLLNALASKIKSKSGRKESKSSSSGSQLKRTSKYRENLYKAALESSSKKDSGSTTNTDFKKPLPYKKPESLPKASKEDYSETVVTNTDFDETCDREVAEITKFMKRL